MTPQEFITKHEVKIKPLSVNQVWQGRRYRTPVYNWYEKELMYLLPKQIQIPEGRMGIYLEFGFSTKASDGDNPMKPLIDILQKKYQFNDNRIYEYTIIKKVVKKGEEYIKFKFIDLEE